MVKDKKTFGIGWITGVLIMVFVPILLCLVSLLVVVLAPLYLVYLVVDRFFELIENLAQREPKKKPQLKAQEKSYSFIADTLKHFNQIKNDNVKDKEV